MTFKKILPLALSLVIGVVGCATTGKRHIITSSFDREINMNGYTMADSTLDSLRNLAGVYAGTMKIDRSITEQDGEKYLSYLIKGSYSQTEHPEALARVLKEADTNKDKIITKEEAGELELDMVCNYFE